MIRAWVALALLASVSGTAWAEGKSAPSSAPANNREEAPRQKIEIEDEFVDGAVVKPTFESITARRKSKHPSLIVVRASFTNELLRSAREL
jgi:hypothetical protein